MIKNEHYDFERNRDAAHANGMGDYFDERWDTVRTEHPWIKWDDMCVFRAQALVADLPDDPSRDALIQRMLLVAEPSAVDTLVDGTFADACNLPIEEGTEQIVILPSAVFFMDGRIRRSVMMAASYVTLTSIKLCRLAGLSPELLLASPEGKTTFTLDEARAGLNRMTRLQVGGAVTPPTASDIGPYFTDEDIADRIRA